MSVYVFILGIAIHIQSSASILTPSQNLSLQRACAGYDVCFAEDATISCCLPCSCDITQCSLKGNCCPHIHTPGITTSRPTKSLLETKCTPTTINLKNVHKPLSEKSDSLSTSHLGVLMITSCPDDANETRCTEPDITQMNQTVPIYNAENGITYRNIFCANCNQISIENNTDLKRWKTYVSCSQKTIIKADALLFPSTVEKIFTKIASTEYQQCGIDFIPPDGVDVKSDLCFEEEKVVNGCPANFSDQSTIDACNQFHMPYISMQENETFVYRNYFCYLCNDQPNDNHSCHDNVGIQLHENNNLVAELNTDKGRNSQSMALWVQDDLTPSRYVSSGVKCEGATTFDPYLDSCRPWHCPTGRQLVNNECVPIYDDFIKATFGVTLKIIPINSSLTEFQSTNKSQLTNDILSEMFVTDNLITTEVVILAESTDSSYLFVYILISAYPHTNLDVRIFNQTTYEREISWNNRGRDITANIEFAIGYKIELNTFPFSDIVIVDMIDYTALTNIYRVDIEEIRNSFRFTQITKQSFCTLITLNTTEVRDYIDIVDIIASGMRVYTGEFMKTSNQVCMCLSDYLREAQAFLDKKNQVLSHSAQAIVSVVCNMLSMAGLAITILTYIFFEELRSIPGKNNMMLAVHLLIAQILYQFGMDQTETPKLCIVLGMLIHLFWLTAIFWMNACTLHMFRTFVTGQSYRSVRAFDPQICCYALYCYGIAISMVSVNVAVSLYRSDGKDIGYGGRVCYISNPVMVGWVFALPVGVIIILNMGFFLAVVYQISASTMRRRGKSTDRANTVIYMKLSSLTGVTWIFGYLYLWTDFIPLEYIFIVLNAGQGVFIFFSFICTHRITKLYWNLFRKYCRLCRENRTCACICGKKLSGESEGNVVEMNTAKISLTAASSSKFPNRGNKQLKLKTNGFKSTSDSQSDYNYKSQSSPDVFVERGRKLPKDSENPEVAADSPNGKKDIKMDFVNYNTAGFVAEGLQNGLNSIAAAAVGLHNIEFIPAKHHE